MYELITFTDLITLHEVKDEIKKKNVGILDQLKRIHSNWHVKIHHMQKWLTHSRILRDKPNWKKSVAFVMFLMILCVWCCCQKELSIRVTQNVRKWLPNFNLNAQNPKTCRVPIQKALKIQSQGSTENANHPLHANPVHLIAKLPVKQSKVNEIGPNWF